MGMQPARISKKRRERIDEQKRLINLRMQASKAARREYGYRRGETFTRPGGVDPDFEGMDAWPT